MTKNLSSTLNEHLEFIDNAFLYDFRFKHVYRIAFAYNNESLREDLLNIENLINSSFNNLPPNLTNKNNRKYFISSFKDFICGKASVCYAGKTSSIVNDDLKYSATDLTLSLLRLYEHGDYRNITEKALYDNVSYNESITAIERIIDSDVLKTWSQILYSEVRSCLQKIYFVRLFRQNQNALLSRRQKAIS